MLAVYTNQLDEGTQFKENGYPGWAHTIHIRQSRNDFLINSNEKPLIVGVPYEQSCVTAQWVG